MKNFIDRMTPKIPSQVNTQKNLSLNSFPEISGIAPTTNTKIVKTEILKNSSEKRNFTKTVSASKITKTEIVQMKEKIVECVSLIYDDCDNDNKNDNENNDNKNKNENADENGSISKKKRKNNVKNISFKNIVSEEKKKNLNKTENIFHDVSTQEMWTCLVCTFHHRTIHERTYLQCSVCCSNRPAVSLSLSH